MERNHTSSIRQYFKIEQIGCDLGNIEVKESTKHYHRFTIEPKDNVAEYFLFYDLPAEFYALVKRENLPQFKKRRDVRLSQVLNSAFFITKNPIHLMWEVLKIIEDQNYCVYSHEEVVNLLQKELGLETSEQKEPEVISMVIEL